MLKMTHLSKAYRTEVVETYALRDFSINVREGEFVAVTGPSGSGKTTFLTIAGLLEEFTGGEYLLDGADVRGLNDNQRSKLRNEKIGFIFQAFNLIPDLNVYDNIEVPLRYRGLAAGERKRRIQASLQRVGLSGGAGSEPARATIRPSSPAASSSVSRSPAPWPAPPGCCWRTSLPVIWTRRWHAASWNCSRSCTATGPPSSW
jgi:ABC-type lipoprotein export system ATPase subunit